MPQHNSGYGSFDTCPSNLRPYGLMAYICGSGLENKQFRLHLEQQWKLNQESLILNNNKDPRVWAREAGQKTINNTVQREAFLAE